MVDGLVGNSTIMAKKIKFGIIGCSEIANSSTIPAILESKFAELEFIGSRTSSKARKFARSLKLKNSVEWNNYWKNNKPFILAFWHNQLMLISYCWKSNSKINVLASGHSDGRFGAIIAKYLGSKNCVT